MATIEPVDVFARGRREGGSVYAYRVRGRDRSAVVLWIAGQGDEQDQVYASAEAGGRHVPTFVTDRQARMYVRRRGRRPVLRGAATLELVRVQRWLEDPVRREVPRGLVLETWNFFEDLARGLDAVRRLPEQGAEHDSAYEKLFGDGSAAWDPGERRAALGLITAGVELWNSCPVIGNPASVELQPISGGSTPVSGAHRVVPPHAAEVRR